MMGSYWPLRRLAGRLHRIDSPQGRAWSSAEDRGERMFVSTDCLTPTVSIPALH
jgi:hypothetical protein